MQVSKTSDPWIAYAPDTDAPWNLARVVHLHRRAGFAMTWREIQRDLKDGPTRSIERVLQGKGDSPAAFEQTATLLADSAVGARDGGRLKAWWVYRMFFGPDPLAERLTLAWHNHFATSLEKVRDPARMFRQNELLRRYGRDRFAELLTRVVKDPAMLVWLDADQNRKGRPNENLAREVMELFTLGVGHYSESDVKEAARALTGWALAGGEQLIGANPAMMMESGRGFRFDRARHDPDEKNILGKSGNWTGDDLLKMLLEHPATARRLAFRLSEMFFGEKVLEPAALDALAAGLREQDLDINWGVSTVLRSRLFFMENNLRTRVLGPVEFVVSSARMLETFAEPPSTLLLADWAARLGQDLFMPPNVGGWPGGRQWISTQSMIGRANFVAALVEGRLTRSQTPVDVLALAEQHGASDSTKSLLSFLSQLVLGTSLDERKQANFLDAVGSAKPTADAARKLAALVMASPEASIG
jgi:uncharacterized protein (DUF1800 family)